MNETLSTVFDPMSGEMVTGYMFFPEVLSYITVFGKVIAATGTLFIVTLIAWDLVRHFMEAREVPDYE